MRSIRWILVFVMCAGPLGSQLCMIGPQTAQRTTAERLEEKRTACLQEWGLLEYRRAASLNEFVREPTAPGTGSWPRIRSWLPGFRGPICIGKLPPMGLQIVQVEPPVALGPRDTDSTVFQYDDFTLTYDARPVSVKECALFELRRLASGQEIGEDLRLRVARRVEKENDLDLVRESLALSTKEETGRGLSIDEALYRYALTRGQVRLTDGKVVRELSLGRRAILCFGLERVLESRLITIMVYEDSRRLYDVRLAHRRLKEPTNGAEVRESNGSQDFMRVLRSVIECALEPPNEKNKNGDKSN